MIGSLGDVEFEVNENRIRTFNSLSFTRQANYAEHKIISSHGLLEFTGFNALSASMKIIFDVSQGVNPREEMNKLHEMFNNHEAETFILNGEIQGMGLWIIESMNENYDIVGPFGELLRLSLSLTLKEYL